MSTCKLKEFLIHVITELLDTLKKTRRGLTPNFVSKFTNFQALKFTQKYHNSDTSSKAKEIHIQKIKKSKSKSLHSKLNAPAEEDLITPWNVQSASEKGFNYKQIMGIQVLMHSRFLRLLNIFCLDRKIWSL